MPSIVVIRAPIDESSGVQQIDISKAKYGIIKDPIATDKYLYGVGVNKMIDQKGEDVESPMHQQPIDVEPKPEPELVSDKEELQDDVEEPEELAIKEEEPVVNEEEPIMKEEEPVVNEEETVVNQEEEPVMKAEEPESVADKAVARPQSIFNLGQLADAAKKLKPVAEEPDNSEPKTLVDELSSAVKNPRLKKVVKDITPTEIGKGQSQMKQIVQQRMERRGMENEDINIQGGKSRTRRQNMRKNKTRKSKNQKKTRKNQKKQVRRTFRR